MGWLDKSTCSTFSAPSGYKLKSNAGSIYCAVATCNQGNCCDTDTSTCGGGGAVACTTPATHYWDTTKAATTRGATPGTACCSAKVNCGSHTCAAGYKAKGSAASITCALGTCTTAECCDVINTECAGINVATCTYGSNYFKDPAKGGTTPTTSGIDCCSLKATCPSTYACPTGQVLKTSRCNGAVGTCNDLGCCEWLDKSTCSTFSAPSGYKLKSNAGSIYCAVATCNQGNCCDTDTSTCGGGGA